MATEHIANELTLTRRQTIYGLVGLGIVLIGVFGWLGWTRVYQNPARVFWDTLANNLATTGVTRQVTESANGQTLDEYVQLELGSSNIAHSETTLSESGSTISTEVIGTPTVDYTRYTDIRTTTKGANGKPLDFSKVLGVWGKSAASSSDNALNHLFGQTLLGIVPIANLPANDRQILMGQIHKAFVPKISSIKHSIINGQRVYIYDVQVRPTAYASLMQVFGKYEGLGTLSALDPNNYKNSAALSVQLAINPISHELVRISYTGSNHTENYSGYGLQPAINLPTKAISASELQQRLTAIH